MDKAIFLDRDQTISDTMGYIKNYSEFKWFDFSFEALKILQETGRKLIIITNQGGVSMGFITEKELNHIHQKMLNDLKNNGINIHGVYYCPHHNTNEECTCRKPGNKMIMDAAKEHKLNLTNCYMIGDGMKDVIAGNSSGCKTILLKTGYGGKDLKTNVKPDYTAENLLEAAKMIRELENNGSKQR